MVRAGRENHGGGREARNGERVDERDTMFARMARRPGTLAYHEFYSRRPELQRVDDRLRALPELGRPGGILFDPRVAGEADRWFAAIESQRPDERLVADLAARLRSGTDLALGVHDLCRALGAVAAGCAPVEPAFVYSAKGRPDADYGRPVDLDHPSAVVFLVEMEFAAMQHAPWPEVLRESARQYYRAADISRTVAAVLQHCGYQARAHYDAHYDVILPPLAVRAGLGEMGRNNILIAHRFGSRVRIGAISTDAPLRHDRPVSLGARAFCERCRKCADNCPSRALSTGPPDLIRGVQRWSTRTERCYGYWRTIGSDCGICIAVCPFSHRNTPLHSLVRWTVRRVPCSHRPLLWCDDLLYGRSWRGLPGARGEHPPGQESKQDRGDHKQSVHQV